MSILQSIKQAHRADLDNNTYKIVLSIIADSSGPHGECWLKKGTLAEHAHRCEMTIRRAIRKLEDAGEIVTVPMFHPHYHHQIENGYILTSVADTPEKLATAQAALLARRWRYGSHNNDVTPAITSVLPLEEIQRRDPNEEGDLDQSPSLKEKATALPATASDSTPPTVTVTELSSQQPTATASSQQAEIDACLLAYNDAGCRTMSKAELRIFTTTVRTAGPRAMLDAIDVAAVQAEKGKDTLHVHYIRKIAENLAAGTAAPTRPATRHRNHATTNWPAIAAEHNRTAALEVTPTDDGDANRAEVHAIAERLLGGSGQYWDVLRTAVDAGMDRHGAAAVRDALEFAKATTPGKFDRRALRNVLATVPVRVPA